MNRQLLPLSYLDNEDRRDYIWRPLSTTEVPTTGVIDNRQYIYEIENQYEAGACVANATHVAIEAMQKRMGVDVLDGSRMFTYNDGRYQNDHLDDDGMYIRWAWDSLRDKGIPPEKDYPYNISKQREVPPPRIYKIAEDNWVARYEYVVPYRAFGPRYRDTYSEQEKIDRILMALSEGHVLVVGHPVTSDIFDLSGPWQTHRYNHNLAEEYAGGHAYCIVGADIDKKLFLCANSWGTEWGDGGYFGMPFKIVDTVFFDASLCRSMFVNDKLIEVKEDKKVVISTKSYWRINVEVFGYDDQEYDVWVAAKDVNTGDWYVRQTQSPEEVYIGASGRSDVNTHDVFVKADENSEPTGEYMWFSPRQELAAVAWFPFMDNPEYTGHEIYMAIVPHGKNVFEATEEELFKLATLPIER